MDRRDFLKTSGVGAAALAASGLAGGLVTSCAPAPKKEEVELKLSFQEGTAPRETLDAKLDYMEEMGIVGLEPGGRGLSGRVNEFQQALRGRNIKISAICAGFDGFILAEDPAVKAEFDSTMRDIIGAAGALGSTGVIMVPAFNGQAETAILTFTRSSQSLESTLSSAAPPSSSSPSTGVSASISALSQTPQPSAATATAKV